MIRPDIGLRRVVVHLFFVAIAWAISLCLSLLPLNLAMNLPQHRYDHTTSILSPVFWIPGLFVGLMINRVVEDRRAYLAPAILGLLAFVAAVLSDISLTRHSVYLGTMTQHPNWRSEIARFFGKVSPLVPGKEDRVLTQLFVTFPFLSSVAYTLGGCVAIKFGRNHPLPETTAIK